MEVAEARVTPDRVNLETWPRWNKKTIQTPFRFSTKWSSGLGKSRLGGEMIGKDYPMRYANIVL